MIKPRVIISDSFVNVPGSDEVSRPVLSEGVVNFVSECSKEGLRDVTYFVKLADQLSNGKVILEHQISKGELAGSFSDISGTFVSDRRTNTIQLFAYDEKTKKNKVEPEIRITMNDPEISVSYSNPNKHGLVSAKYSHGTAYEVEGNKPIGGYLFNIKTSFYNAHDPHITGGNYLEKATIVNEKDKKLLEEGLLPKNFPTYSLVMPDGKVPLKPHLAEMLMYELNMPDRIINEALQLIIGTTRTRLDDKTLSHT